MKFLRKADVKLIPLRVRKQYFIDIVNGTKPIEYRKYSDYWKKRLNFPSDDKVMPIRVAVFICGKRVFRREILRVVRIVTPDWFSDQGKQDVSTANCFALMLGEEVSVVDNITVKDER